jgi:DNA mismatch repair ATPase MutL
MIRPSVSFTLKSTLYTATTTTNGDHDDVPFSRNDAQTTATILHLPAGRSSSTSIAAFFFGESTTTTTAVPSHNFITISTSSHNGQHPFSVKGYTALPPYGHPNTSRQLIYLDGRSISAPRVTSMIDSLFLTACRACNKAGITVKGRQLLSIKAALNMKPMYVLHLRSSPSSSFPPFASTATATAATAFSTEYPLQEEVAFKDWNVAIEIIEKAILTAWAPCLPISLIDKLQNYQQQQQQQQEVRKIGGGVGGGRERSRDAAHNRRNDDSSTKRHQRQQQQQPQEQLRALTDGDIIIMGNKKNSNASSSSNNNNNTGRTWSGGYTKLSGQASAMASRPRFIAPLLLVTEQVEKGVEKRGGGKGEEGYRPMSRLGQRHGKDALVVGTERRTASAPAPLSGNPKKRRKERSPKEGGGEGGVILVWPQRKPSSSEGGGGGGKNKSTGSKGKSGSGLAGEQQQQQQQQQQLHKVPPMKRTSPPPPLAAMNTKRTKVDVLFSSWKNPAFPATNTSSSFMVNVPNIDSLASSSFMTTTLKPPRITRDNLKHCEILNQVDCKFILARDGDVVFAVDQHAADERVRLESLKGMILGSDGAPRCDSLDFNHYSSSEGEEEGGGGGGGGGGKEGGNNNSTPTDTNNATSHYVLSSMPLDRPTPLDLAPDEGLLLETYHSQVTAWGWKWRTKMTTTKMFWELTHVPVLLGSTYFTPTDLKLYLHQLQATCGTNALPPVAVRVLNSKACRSAIMFGDTLDEEECREVLVGLRETRLYEICAHGRPTVVGLVDLGEMERALRLVGGADGGRRSGGDGGVNGGVGGGLKAKLMADLESGGKRKKNGSGLP